MMMMAVLLKLRWSNFFLFPFLMSVGATGTFAFFPHYFACENDRRVLSLRDTG